MADETKAEAPVEPSFDDLLAQYIAGEESGSAPDRQQLLKHYPQFADDLREFFANRDQMQRLAQPLRGDAPVPCASLPLGKVRYFGDYELLEEVAAGGMGIIYKARQRSLNRIVAVKMILKGTLAREDDVKRFRAEAEAAASLQHPAIVAIHEVGLHEGQHYFSMDYVDGHSLAELPREQPLSAHQAAEYIRDAAEAVHYAHQHGTLHRDLKPSNVLIDRQGRVRITDFGLAKRIEGNSDLTLTGQILGTPSYMPPEQATSKRSLVGVASDIYSLGAVLYELLTGRPPFRGESPAETLRQVETLDPVSPRLLNPTVPRDLETICLKCLEKEPHKRYGTSQLLADDLGRYLRGEPILARPIGRVARAWRWCKRKPVAAGLVAVSIVAVIALTGAGVAVSYNDQLQTALIEATAQRAKAETLLTEVDSARNVEVDLRREKETLLADAVTAKLAAEKARHEANNNLYLYRIALADRDLTSGNLAAANDILQECPKHERHWEWHLLDRKARGDSVATTIEAHDLAVYQVTFSPDGQALASAGRDGDVKLWNLDSGQLLRTFHAPQESYYGVAFSPDGERLAAAAGPKLWNGGPQSIHSTGKHRGAIVIWNVRFGDVLMTLEGHSRTVFSVAFDPTGTRLASASLDNTVRIWDVQSGEQLQQLEAPGSGYGSFSTFSPGGELLVIGLRTGPVSMWDTTNWQRLFEFRHHEQGRSGSWGPFRIAFTPNSQYLASTYQALKDGIQLHDVKSGQLVRSFGIRPAREPKTGRQDPPSQASYLYETAFSPDGGRLATVGANGSVKLWDMSTLREVLSMQHVDSLFSVKFCPAGRRLAVGSGRHAGSTKGRITIWDAGIAQSEFAKNHVVGR